MWQNNLFASSRQPDYFKCKRTNIQFTFKAGKACANHIAQLLLFLGTRNCSKNIRMNRRVTMRGDEYRHGNALARV